MAYNPLTDFVALLRLTAGSASTERMPGLDYVVAALARAGLFALSVGQTAPTSNQPTTVWLKPSLPSWVAEGVVFLWNVSTAQYEPATPALWSVVLALSGQLFQSVAVPAGVVGASTSLLAVQRVGPAATALLLPRLTSRPGRQPLQIVDWSSAITNHAITVTTPDGATIMQLTSWQLLSTVDQLAGVTLYPSFELNGWVIAP